MRFFIVASLLIAQVCAQDGPETVMRGTKQFRKNVVVSGLAGPWEVTWGPDGKLWVTERTGKRVTRVDPATGTQNVAITIDEVSAPGGQDGLLGMALHPDLLKGNRQRLRLCRLHVCGRKQRARTRPFTDPKSPYRYLYAKIVRLDLQRGKRDAVQSGRTSSPGCRPAMTTLPAA